MADRPSPTDEARRLYEDAEARTARAVEQLVARESFGELLARVTENVLAVTKLSTDAADLVVRNLRLAGRKDITGLARQIARTEDKLELLLQEVERLQQAVEHGGGQNGSAPARAAGGTGSRSGTAADGDS